MTQDLSFSRDEYEARLAVLRAALAGAGLDAAIVDEIEAMTYFSGYGVSDTMWRALVVPLHQPPFLMVRSLDAAPARARAWTEIVGYPDWRDPIDVLAEALESRGLARGRHGLDLESPSMPAGRFNRLCARLPAVDFADFGARLRAPRLRKSPAEIAYLERAAAIADAAMDRAISAVREGGRHRDVAAAAAVTYLELGADDALVGPLSAGADWDSLHAPAHDEPLTAGAVVHIELVPRVREYSSRLMRSVVVGRPTLEQRDTIAQLSELQDRQIAALVPGAAARDVDAVLRRPMIECGLRPSYENVTGYTLGAYPYPTPRISDFEHCLTPAAAWMVEAGMVMHLYTSARGLALSETVLVTADGPRRLTRTARTLFSTEGA